MQNVLITGGAGFIGHALTLRLLSKGYDVTVLDSLSEQIHGKNPEITSSTYPLIKGKCKFIHSDIRSRMKLRESLIGAEAVIHLAAQTGTGQSMYQIADYTDVNVLGTAYLLEEIARIKTVKKIIVASSRAIYGEGRYSCKEHGIIYPNGRELSNLQEKQFDLLCPTCLSKLQPIATHEDSALKPLSIYATTKLAQEHMVLNASSAYNLSGFALRFQNVYGPGQSLLNPYTGILSIFTNLARQNKPISIFEDGKESRDFVYIDDVLTSIELALNYQDHKTIGLNVGSGYQTDVNEVVTEIIKFYNSLSEVKITSEFRMGDIRHNFADLTLIRQTLGFQPSVKFKDGIRLFLKWAQTQPSQFERYEESLLELKTRGLLKS